jgi:predicted aspartyl protease
MFRSHGRRFFAACIACVSVLCAGAPAPAAGECRLGSLETLHLDTGLLAPVVAGTVNGTPVQALLDTGAALTILTPGAAERTGLEVLPSRAKVYGVGGPSAIYNTRVEHLQFGPLHADQIDLSVVRDVKGPWDVIVGADVLLNHDLELALGAKEARVVLPTACKDAFLAYWSPEASAVAMHDVSVHDGRQVVTVEVDGTPLRALLDSGASFSVIDSVPARLIGLRPEQQNAATRTAVGGVGQMKVDFRIAPIATLVLGRETIRDTRIAVGDLFKATIDDRSSILLSDRNAVRAYDMILGQDFLRSHRVLFARSQQRFYFSYVGGPIFAVNRPPPPAH